LGSAELLCVIAPDARKLHPSSFVALRQTVVTDGTPVLDYLEITVSGKVTVSYSL
jgi:hypothetical protein